MASNGPCNLLELLTPAGQAALAAAEALPPGDETFLANLARLDKRFPTPLAKAALETATLRAKARSKFTRAQAMYFTREALEQASGEAIARYRARRFGGLASVVDLGCGIGGDSLALAEHCRVTGFDLDPLRLAMAAQNAAAYGARRAGRIRGGRFHPPGAAAGRRIFLRPRAPGGRQAQVFGAPIRAAAGRRAGLAAAHTGRGRENLAGGRPGRAGRL